MISFNWTSRQNIEKNVLSTLQNTGWVQTQYPASEDLLNLASLLGKPVSSRPNGPLVDRLVPKTSEDAHPNSMSTIYGLGDFPFHTDSANFITPPRFVILRLAQDAVSERPTFLLDSYNFALSASEKKNLFRDVWLVSGGIKRFYTSILNEDIMPNFCILRFDPCCMTPAHKDFICSAEILHRACLEAETVTINWIQGNVVILDNWRILHARGAYTNTSSEKRVLERVLVKQKD